MQRQEGTSQYPTITKKATMSSENRPTCLCGKAMTPQNSRIAPDLFLCDECVPKHAPHLVGETPISTPRAPKVTAQDFRNLVSRFLHKEIDVEEFNQKIAVLNYDIEKTAEDVETIAICHMIESELAKVTAGISSEYNLRTQLRKLEQVLDSEFKRHPLPWRVEKSFFDGPEYVWIMDSSNKRVGRFNRETAEFIVGKVNAGVKW